MPKNTVKDYYNDVAADYTVAFYEQEDPYPSLRYRHRYMLELLDAEGMPAGGKVLDIGCGPGEMVRDLGARGWEVWGIDISEEMIAIARRKAGEAGLGEDRVHLGVGDIEALDFPDGMFDAVMCAGVVEYLDGDERWSAELYRVLRPGGVLVINITNKYAVRRWTLSLFERLKASRAGYGVMDFIKRRLLGRGTLNRFPFRPRTHSPRGFDRFMEERGFNVLDHRYFDFSLLPYPGDTLLDPVMLPLRMKLERFAAGDPVLSGNGYIVKAQKGGDESR